MDDLNRLAEAARRAIGTALVHDKVDELTRLLEAMQGAAVPDREHFSLAASDLFEAELGNLHGLLFRAIAADTNGELYDGDEQRAVEWLAGSWGIVD